MSVLGADNTHGDSRSGWCMVRVAIRVIETDGTVTWKPSTSQPDHEHCQFAACGCCCHEEKKL